MEYAVGTCAAGYGPINSHAVPASFVLATPARSPRDEAAAAPHGTSRLCESSEDAYHLDDAAVGGSSMTDSWYDEMAEWYDSVLRSGTIVQDAAMAVLHQLIGPVDNLRICDLACGQGIMARALAGRGAHVVGVDTSKKLLEIARATEPDHDHRVEYMEMNAETLAELTSSSFDGVVSNLALMDIDDLQATSVSVHRVLRPGAWFAFTIMHPCFQTPVSTWISEGSNTGRVVSAYFAEGRWRPVHRTGMRSRVGAVHRTLSTYFNTLSAAGLVLQMVAEPEIAREPGVLEPAYDTVPAVLAARFFKP